MSNNPFNSSFDTRASWERGTAQDFTNSMNAAAWDRQQGSFSGGGGVYSGPGDRTLAGRAKAFGSVGLLLGLLGGALHGGGNHSLVSSTFIGLVSGAAIGAGFGAAWHLLMMMFGGVARLLNLPVIREAIRGAVFGVVAGLVRWRRLSGQFGGLAKVGSGSFYAASLRSGLALSGASPG